MTLKEKIKKLLADNGLWPNQCDEVLQLLEDDEDNASMQGRWTDSADGYSPQTLTILWMGAKDKALEYIDANCPQAWFRPMFTDDRPIPSPDKLDDGDSYGSPFGIVVV